MSAAFFPYISVIIPVLNEEKHIRGCVDSLAEQTYSANKMQIIFVDGMSSDKTRDIINEYISTTELDIIILENQKKIAPCAMNIGIAASNGEYIIRIDAHSEYENDYIEKCVSTISTIDADNVGGLAMTKGYGNMGEAFAQVLSSKFGVGNSGFRTRAKSDYVDTVPFGTYKKETFEKYGLYNEQLVRNQDYELNFRIRKNGGKIYLNSDIKLYYICKNDLKGICKQSFSNGLWNVITMKLCPGSMGFRHFIPFIFFVSLIIMPIFSIFIPYFIGLFIGEIVLYLLCNIVFSIDNAEPRYRNRFFIKFYLFFIFHISYGFGSFVGLFKKI
jgi:Glycosyltransferases, probably involved in cell wall biogenesis